MTRGLHMTKGLQLSGGLQMAGRLQMTGSMAGGLEMTLRLQMTKGLQPGKVEPGSAPLNNERQRITKDNTAHKANRDLRSLFDC